jgi:hypothetical protein
MVAAWLLYVLPVDAMYSDNLSMYSCQTVGKSDCNSVNSPADRKTFDNGPTRGRVPPLYSLRASLKSFDKREREADIVKAVEKRLHIE